MELCADEHRGDDAWLPARAAHIYLPDGVRGSTSMYDGVERVVGAVSSRVESAGPRKTRRLGLSALGAQELTPVRLHLY